MVEGDHHYMLDSTVCLQEAWDVLLPYQHLYYVVKAQVGCDDDGGDADLGLLLLDY